MRSGKTTILHFSSQVLRSVAGFLATFFIARYLGASPLGIYSQALTLLFWFKFPTNSINTPISKRLSENDPDKGVFLAGISIIFGYTLFAAAIIVIFNDYINTYLGEDLALLLPVLLLANAGFDIIVSGLIGVNKVALSGWLGTGERVIRLIGQVGLALLGYAVLGLLLGYLASLAIFCVFGLYLLRDQFSLPSKESFLSISSFARYSWLGSLKGNTLNWMDIFVLGFFVSDDLIGIYQVAWTLASFLAIIGSSIAATLFPKISSLSSRKNLKEVKHLLNEGLVFAGVFLIPGLFGALVIGSDLLQIYRPEFAKGATVLIVLIAARTANTFGSQFVNTINAINKPEVAFRVNMTFILTNIVLNVILVFKYGWYGAALATLISSIVFLAMAYRFLGKEIGGIELPVREISMQILASSIMFTIVAQVTKLLPTSHVYTLVVIFFGSVIYVAVLIMLSKRIRKKMHSLL